MRDVTVFDVADAIFNEAFNSMFGPGTRYVPAKLEKQICDVSFPPSNVTINPDTKVMTISCALAGVAEDEFNLEFVNDTLKLRVKKHNADSKDESIYLQRGLKLAYDNQISWKIDLRNYDRDSIECKFENGLLTITIQPSEATKPMTKKLFGKLNVEAIEAKPEADEEKSED